MADSTVQNIVLVILLDELGKSFIDDLNSSCSIDIEWDADDIVDNAINYQGDLVSIWSTDNFLS